MIRFFSIVIVFLVSCDFSGYKGAKRRERKEKCLGLKDSRRKWEPNHHLTPFGSCDVKNFLDYCLDENISPEMKHTVEAIKDKIGESECQVVWDIIKNKEQFSLNDSGIKDITPLGGMTRLKYLSLKNNQIDDIWILVTFRFLQDLHLEGNPIDEREIKDRNCVRYLEGYRGEFDRIGEETNAYKKYCGFD